MHTLTRTHTHTHTHRRLKPKELELPFVSSFCEGKVSSYRYTHTHTHIHTYIHTCKFVCIIVCMFTHTHLHTHSYKPWLDETDKDNVFFASVHGYAKFDSFYPSSGVCLCVCV
jgi:hypothetical protein